MGWTKRQLIEQAYDEIGYAASAFDLDGDILQRALYKLDAMMATWDKKGIQLGYPLTLSPEDSDLDTDTELPFTANEAVYLNLAIRVAASIGKVASNETKAAARIAYRALLNDAAMPNEMQLPRDMPRGAGNKPWIDDNEFLDTPDTSPVRLGDNDQLMFEG